MIRMIRKEDIQNIIGPYLVEDGSDEHLKITVHSILTLFAPAMEQENGEDIDKDWICQPLFEEMIKHIKQHPHDDPIQPKLVKLLGGIKTSSPKEPWRSLAPLGMYMREIWNGWVTSHGIDGWTRLNAFAARLTATEVMDFDTYAIWEMRYALEDFPLPEDVNGGGEQSSNRFESLVPSASVWILYNGERMWNLGLEEEKEWPIMMKGGPLWTGKQGFSQGRWNLWNMRFGELSKREDLSCEVLHMSKAAHEKMLEIES